MKSERSLTLVEFLLTLCIIFVLIGLFAMYANTTLRLAREAALQNELMNIRMSIEYYRMVKGKLPESLFLLMNQKITFKDLGGVLAGKGFLKSFRVDEEDNLLDPFRNRYYYDNREGRVNSRTKGCENW